MNKKISHWSSEKYIEFLAKRKREKMNKKGQVLVRHYLIGIVIFTLMVMGGVGLIGEFRKTDSNFVDSRFESFNQTFNTYDDITSQVANMRGNIEGSNAEGGNQVLGYLNNLINMAWSSIRLWFGNFTFMNSVFMGLSTMFGVPVWIISLTLLLISILFIFAIYTAIFGRDI